MLTNPFTCLLCVSLIINSLILLDTCKLNIILLIRPFLMACKRENSYTSIGNYSFSSFVRSNRDSSVLHADEGNVREKVDNVS